MAANNDKAYYSAINLLDTREINPAVLDINNDEGLTDIMGIAGRYQKTEQAIYHNKVAEALFKQGVIDPTAVTGAGTKASPYVAKLTAATSGYARKGDLVKMDDSKVGQIVNVSTAGGQDTISIQMVVKDATTTGLANGKKIAFFSQAVGAQSTAPKNRRFGMTNYYNVIQAFREVNEEDDIQSMSALEVSFGGKNYIHVKNLADKFLMMKTWVNGALIGGSLSSSQFTDAAADLVDPGNGGNEQTTRGLDEYVTTYGINDTVATPGTFVTADLEDLIDQLIAKKAPKSYTGYTPSKVQLKIDSYFKGLGSANITSGRLSLDGKEFDFGVSKVTHGNFTIQFAGLPVLDNQELFANTDIVKSMYLIPNDKVKTVKNGDQPRLQIRYMPHNVKSNTGNDIWAEWHTGALAITGATSDEAIWRTNWLTYQGLEALGVQHFAKMKVLA